MNITRPLLMALLWLASWAAPGLGWAQTPGPLPPPGQYSKNGADTCLECHDDETAAYSASALFKTKHAQRSDKRSPFGVGGLQCESCHGPGALHARNKKAASIKTFKGESAMPVAQRNEVCLGCHEGSARTGWHAGAHERADVACTDCHQVHKAHDPVLRKATEPQVCMSCHKQQRADFHKASTHPVGTGRMGCSDCHAPHGSATQGMLAKPTLNQTCYSCHADKRGPLLWEHAPVAEDCALCHAPHGSVRTALLTKSPPLLCQQCHSAAGHPSVARSGAGLPGSATGGSVFVMGSSCTNCHSQVHGSNHPAGAKLMR
jgi:DmsE family decaheme c-type cytochrome